MSADRDVGFTTLPAAEPGPAGPAPSSTKPQRLFVARLKNLVRQPSGVAGLALLLVLVVAAVLAPVLAPYDFAMQQEGRQLLPPSGDHLLGTDQFGRDILSRLIYGSRISIGLATVSVLAGSIVGTLLGLWAGYTGGWFDSATMRVVDVLLAYPAILLGIVVVIVLGPGLVSMGVAIAVINVSFFARLARASAIREREFEYVHVARALGASPARVLFTYLLPGTMGAFLIQFSVSMAGAVLVEAGLSFLGLGVQPPMPSWGLMLEEGQSYMADAPALAIAPGLALVLLLVALNLTGEALKKTLDPRLLSD